MKEFVLWPEGQEYTGKQSFNNMVILEDLRHLFEVLTSGPWSFEKCDFILNKREKLAKSCLRMNTACNWNCLVSYGQNKYIVVFTVTLYKKWGSISQRNNFTVFNIFIGWVVWNHSDHWIYMFICPFNILISRWKLKQGPAFID